jgi:hypothetical protein
MKRRYAARGSEGKDSKYAINVFESPKKELHRDSGK